jgi:iron transport multicopper oxidase
MDLGTTVHWHGMHQHKSNWADGVAWVTQCPIEPGNSFLYEFEVKDQAGTFWYHSHIGAQYCDGLRGPLIIYDPNDPLKQYYDVDDESTILSLSDWYHKPSVGLVPVAHIAPQIDSVLFNGKGRYELDDEALKSEITIVNVEKGKRYRLRWVSFSYCHHWLV